MSVGDSPYTKRFFSVFSQEEKDKVRGHAFYPSDYLSALLPEAVAHVVVIRSPHPGASFKKVDSESALKVEGVLRVITARDVPNNQAFGSRSKRGQLILADGEVNFRGEPVALVVAETIDSAKNAAQLVEIDWTPRENVEHEKVVDTIKFERGVGLNQKLEYVETSFRFPSLHARYLEPESGWLELTGKDEFLFRVGSLLSESQRLWLSEVLGVPLNKILAEESYLGGQFGGRQQRELIVFLGLASHLCKRSCCLQLEYEDQDIGSYGYSGQMRIGFDRSSGRMRELSGEVRVDSGCYEGKAAKVLMRALEHAAGIYDFNLVSFEGKVLRTPTHPRRSLKGEGMTAVTWVTEQLVDQVAQEMDAKPLDFRVLHARKDNQSLNRVMEEAERIERPFQLLTIDRNRPVWDAKKIEGRGFAFQCFQPSEDEDMEEVDVSIELQGSGSFLIRVSNMTLDLRVKQAICEVAASVLHTHPKAMTVEGKMRREFDQARRRETYPEYYYLAKAAWHVADNLRTKLVEAGREVLRTQSVELREGAVVAPEINRKMGYRELAFTVGVNEMKADYVLKDMVQAHPCSGGAISTVSFHPLTGELNVESVNVVIDAGPVVYRTGVEAEAESSVAWVMAALFSSTVERDQPIPTPVDGPEEVSLFPLEYPLQSYADTPPEFFGSRGLPDVMMSVVLASLASAIQDARGVGLKAIPMEPSFMYPEKKKQTVPLIPFKR